MNWRGKNDIVPAGIVALVAVVAMWRDTMIDQPGIAMTLAGLITVGLVWALSASGKVTKNEDGNLG